MQRPERRRPLLCLVTDRRAARGPLGDAVAAAVAAGVDWVQVREKDLDGAALLALTRGLADAARAADEAVRILVNRRVDVVLAAGADGVHLGFDAMPPEVARRLLGAEALIGTATHAADEAAAAADLSYAHLAPVFTPLSKPAQRPALGLDALSEAARRGPPLLAQGGIDASNAGACVAAGAAGVAVTGAILGAPDPGAAAAALRGALDEAASARRPAGR
ncbi:MAG: thiamine phosphate synthase [Myxococcota bacterium]